tara:strand:- start:24274 stop:24993 length:720 start_codon:yes stop_codon:yes gene_type:complete
MNESKSNKSAMVVVAHADDAEYGCSGTVAKLCAEGYEVVYVLCTDGSKGSSDITISSQELSKIRQHEQVEAGKVLGLKDVVFLNFEDSILEPTLELRKAIAAEIRRHKPNILICPYPMRNLEGRGWGVGHPDHIAAGEAALSAVFPTARDHLSFPELLKEGLEPHNVEEVWIMGHPDPDLWVDVTSHIDTSINALLKHDSQIPYSREEVTKSMKERRSLTAVGQGYDFAEAFRKIPFSS